MSRNENMKTSQKTVKGIGVKIIEIERDITNKMYQLMYEKGKIDGIKIGNEEVINKINADQSLQDMITQETNK